MTKGKFSRAKSMNEANPGSGDELVMEGIGDAIGSVTQLAGSFGSILKDTKLSSVDKMSERGTITHTRNLGGKTMNMATAGANVGKTFGTTGMLVGGAIGAIGGFFGALKDKKPTMAEQALQEGRFQMGLAMKNVRPEDTFAKQQQMAKNGLNVKSSKDIEVEKDEIVLRKIGNSFKKVADFKGGKSHIEGGEQYEASEGDIIIPGKERNKVLWFD